MQLKARRLRKRGLKRMRSSARARLASFVFPLCAVALGATALAESPASIKAAPAFKPAQLTALPTNGWITNGGNLYNQRYSPLTQINRDNVKGLKALWRT